MARGRRRWATILTLGAVVSLGGCAGSRDALPTCRGCNVVLVTFDALRADRLGVYGHSKPTSPALDAFAARSTVFTSCLSQSATTVTAVPAILTGKFPVTDGLMAGLTLRPQERTIATVLRAAGYRTLVVLAHQYARCHYSGCGGVDVIEDAFPVPEAASQTAARVRRLLATEAREAFFLWVHFRQPHAPYDVPETDFRTMLDVPADAPTFFSPGLPREFFAVVGQLTTHYRAAGETAEKMRLIGGSEAEVTPSVVRQFKALYDANVQAGDRAFGAIVADLERRGLLSRTVIVVAADHGEGLGEHGWFGHNRLWQAMLHVPLVVYVPGVPARRVDVPVMNVDILPTIARIVGATLDHPVRGRDLFAPRLAKDLQYAEYSDDWIAIEDGMKVRVRNGVVEGLWDVRRDPAEEHDLAAARPAVATRLRGLGEALRSRTLGGDAAAPAPNIFDRLRALGYVSGDPATAD